MSDSKNRKLLHIELPRSTQSFEKMLDDVGHLTPDHVTITRTPGTVSTTFLDIFHLTGNNNREEIEEIEAVDKISDEHSLSDDSICTACTQCKLAKRLNGASGDIGISGIEAEEKVSSVSECDGLPLFVDQINCENAENYPKRSFSDTLTDSRCVAPEYFFIKRFKSEGFCSASQIRSNSEAKFAMSFEPKKASAIYSHDDEAASEPTVQKELLEASPDPDEHICEELEEIRSADDAADRVTTSSHTLEVGDSTIAQSNIEEVGFEDESKDDDDSKNAAATLEYQFLSPNPTVSTFSQSTIEEVYGIEEDDYEADELIDDFEIRNRSFSDLTISQNTVEEIYYIDATDDIDCPNSIQIAERPSSDSEGKERLPRDSEGKEKLPRDSEGTERLPRDSEETERPPRDSEETERPPRDAEGQERLPRDSEVKERLPRDSEGKARFPRDSEGKERLLRDSEGKERPSQDFEEKDVPSQGEILGETAIASDSTSQIDAGLDSIEKQRIGANPEDFGCMKSLESGTEENNEPVLENFEREEKLAEESLNLATEIGNHGPDIDLLKNEETSRFRDESFLEVSIDSEKTYIEMNLRDKREERTTRAPVDLTLINKKRASIENATAGSSKELDRRDDFEVTNAVRTFQDPLENFTPITEPRRSREDVDDTSLDLLSESELERIEKEAYTNSNRTRIATNLRNANLGKEDRFYRPQRLIADTENNEDLVLPSWVTNPAPEPNYEMMKRRKRSRREYINQTLQEVLRLSEIISKVAKAVREERRVEDPDSAAKQVPRIQDPPPVQSAENYMTYNSRASTSTENRDPFCVPQSSSRPTHNGSNIAPEAGNRSDIFYAPQSLGRPKRYEPPNLSIYRPVKLEATVNTVDENRVNCSEKLYVPQSGGSKYDASFIFGGQRDNLNIGKASCSYNNAEASSFYNPSINSGSLKRDWSGNKTMEYRGSTATLDDRKFETRTSRDSQFPKESFHASFTGNGNIDGINNRKTVAKDAVFYSSDNVSSASRKYTKLPSVENGQIFFSKSLVSERFGSDSTQARPTSLNFGYNQTARTNESVFYSGNK